VGCSGTGFLSVYTIKYNDIKQAATRHRLRSLEKRFEVFNGTYLVGIPDTLNVNVQDHPDLSGSYEVRPDGNISFPLLGDVYAEGHTPMKLAEVLANRLEQFVKKVEVLVTVTGLYSHQVYVFARDRNNGQAMRFTGDMSVLDGLAQSGGWTRQVYSSRIRLCRDSDPEKPEVYRIRADQMMRGDFSTNIMMRENDVLYLPSTLLAEFGYAMEAILYPVNSARQLTEAAGQTPFGLTRGAQESRQRSQSTTGGGGGGGFGGGFGF
jgi:polysaccharide export outer membrane protein